jgi:hypothetical protein
LWRKRRDLEQLLGLVLVDLLEETLEVLMLLGNSVLTVLLVDRAETLPLSKLFHHVALQSELLEPSE